MVLIGLEHDGAVSYGSICSEDCRKRGGSCVDAVGAGSETRALVTCSVVFVILVTGAVAAARVHFLQ